MRAAATPRPSPIPPVAITGTDTASTTCRQQREASPTIRRSALARVERTTMPPGLRTLRNDRVRSRSFSGLCFRPCRRSGKPENSSRLHLRDKRRRVQAHDRRDHFRPRFQNRPALRIEIWQHTFRRIFRHLGSPLREIFSPGRRSSSASRFGVGPGIHKLIWNSPLLSRRNSAHHVAISSGFSSSAPHAPMPPALATSTDNAGGHAPAMGAKRIGKRIPSTAAKSSARASGFLIFSITLPPKSGWSKCAFVSKKGPP